MCDYLDLVAILYVLNDFCDSYDSNVNYVHSICNVTCWCYLIVLLQVTNNSNNNNKPPTGKANGRPSAQMQNKMKDPVNKLDADSQKGGWSMFWFVQN